MNALVCRGILLCVGGMAGVVLAQDREDELTVQHVDAAVVQVIPLDCREVFEVRRSDGDPALKGLTFSSIGWDVEAGEDLTRTVVITAEGGALSASGTFTPDGSRLTVLEERSGRGTFDWQVVDPPKKLYRLTHEVRKNGSPDAAETLYGYLDFTYCDKEATLAEIEKALLHPASHVVGVRPDALRAWQPVDYLSSGTGLETDRSLAQGVRTTIELEFSGHGELSFECRLTGGALSVARDGGEPEVIDVPTGGWVRQTLAFDDGGEHTVVFAYVSGGDGATAAIRRVRWAEDEKVLTSGVTVCDVRTDLSEGDVRAPARMEYVLPFAYSSTNWIGGVSGATAESVARVTIVELTGEDPDVRAWTEKGAVRVLRNAPGEGAVKWRPKKGVWKATFEIPGTTHCEEVWFDLRDAIAPGFMLMVF